MPYGIYEISGGARKTRSFADKSFASLDEAEVFFANAVSFERDPDGFDAADVFTKLGQIFSVERIK